MYQCLPVTPTQLLDDGRTDPNFPQTLMKTDKDDDDKIKKMISGEKEDRVCSNMLIPLNISDL